LQSLNRTYCCHLMMLFKCCLLLIVFSWLATTLLSFLIFLLLDEIKLTRGNFLLLLSDLLFFCAIIKKATNNFTASHAQTQRISTWLFLLKAEFRRKIIFLSLLLYYLHKFNFVDVFRNVEKTIKEKMNLLLTVKTFLRAVTFIFK
jgi:hypothetical protein